jgi:hypothetical protein
MNKKGFDAIFAGNYLTSLVAALGLARAGKRVCVVNPLPGWGGHFTRMTVAGIKFDPGAISHEFTVYSDEQLSNPMQFDSRRRNDVARFNRHIEEFTRANIELNRTTLPDTVYGGKFFPDVITSNRLDILQHPVLAARIAAEQEFLAGSIENDLHPRDKKSNPAYVRKSYYDASVKNHGATLHSAIFEPIFHKMSGVSTTRLLALYHRIAWLPIYYPETLRSQFQAQPQKLPETSFCYPKAGYIGVLGETLVQHLHDAGVTIVRDPVESIDDKPDCTALVMKGGRRLEAPHVAWSLAHDQIVSSITGAPPNKFERWSAMLVFALVPKRLLSKDFSVLYVPDDSIVFYRACNQSSSAGMDEEQVRIVVEVNPEFAAAQGLASEADVLQRVKRDLASLGIVGDPEHFNIVGSRVMRNVLLLPSQENWQLLEMERDILLEAYPRVQFTRNVEAFFTDTLNDQIIKGMKLVEQFRG